MHMHMHMHMHMAIHGPRYTCTCVPPWLPRYAPCVALTSYISMDTRGYPRYAPVVVVLLGLVLGLYVAGVATLPGLAFLVAVFYLQAC